MSGNGTNYDVNHVTQPGYYNVLTCPYCSPSKKYTSWSSTTGMITETTYNNLDWEDEGKVVVGRWITQLVLREICDGLSAGELQQIEIQVSSHVAELIDKGLRARAAKNV